MFLLHLLEEGKDVRVDRSTEEALSVAPHLHLLQEQSSRTVLGVVFDGEEDVVAQALLHLLCVSCILEDRLLGDQRLGSRSRVLLHSCHLVHVLQVDVLSVPFPEGVVFDKLLDLGFVEVLLLRRIQLEVLVRNHPSKVKDDGLRLGNQDHDDSSDQRIEGWTWIPSGADRRVTRITHSGANSRGSSQHNHTLYSSHVVDPTSGCRCRSRGEAPDANHRRPRDGDEKQWLRMRYH